MPNRDNSRLEVLLSLRTMLPAKVKPRFRGVLHQIAFFVSLVAGAVLVAATPAGKARLAVGIFALSLAWLLGVSALYHRPMWPPSMRARLKRLDHASIFLLIAGTYTPFCLLVLGDHGQALLVAIWCGAVVGAVVIVSWPSRPRAFASALYVALGLLALVDIRSIMAVLDGTSFTLFVAGGAVYVVGAVVYALRKPNPNPLIFGYHEVFHALVILACGMHFAAISRVVRTLT